MRNTKYQEYSNTVFKNIVLSGFIFAYSLSSFSAPRCISLFDNISTKIVSSSKKIEPVLITGKNFDQLTKDLKSTLSGKLATVWRSEWKTKLTYIESNQYVLEMIKSFLSPGTQEIVLKGLDINNEGFTQEVHKRISQLQNQKLLNEQDDLLTRDLPTPLGAKDKTFTYYTKAIKPIEGSGKHQIRIRTYVRQINFENIPLNQIISGFDSYGHKISVSKVNEDAYQIQKNSDPVLTLTQKQLFQKYGKDMLLFAPHGKSFKLEVKTALKDLISDKRFPSLGGEHMVQKLDISLSPQQVNRLFSPLQIKDSTLKIKKYFIRLNSLISELIQVNPENKDRITAVFDVLKEAIVQNPDFLEIEGATIYHRTAFESKSGFQTTVDREQGVYAGQMYTGHNLLDPFKVIRENKLISVQEKDARHVELKVPVTSMDKVAGIEFYDRTSAPPSNDNDKDQYLIKAATVYSQFVKNNLHSGKFNYIMKNGNE